MYDESGGSPEDRVTEAREILDAIEGLEGDLNEKEQEFVSNTRERIEKFEERTKISPKQLFWLRDIAEKV